jgi:acyl carrier protein
MVLMVLPDARSPGNNRAAIEQWLVARIAGLQNIDAEQIDIDESFVANGLSSALSVALIGDLARVLGVALPETLTWEYPTITVLAEHVAGIAASSHDD